MRRRMSDPGGSVTPRPLSSFFVQTSAVSPTRPPSRPSSRPSSSRPKTPKTPQKEGGKKRQGRSAIEDLFQEMDGGEVVTQPSGERVERVERVRTAVKRQEKKPILRGQDILASVDVATKAKARMALLQMRSQTVQCSRTAVEQSITVRKKRTGKKDEWSDEDEDNVEVINNDALQHKLLSDQTQDGNFILQQRQEDALGHLEERVKLMRKTFDTIRSEAEDWEKKRTRVESDRVEIETVVQKEQQEQELLMSRMLELKEELEALRKENQALSRKVPVIEFMLDRTNGLAYHRKVRVSELIEAIQILKDCEDECLSLGSVIQKETKEVVKQKRNLRISLEQTEKRYFDKLEERREVIAKMDALADYFCSREENRDHLKKSIQEERLPDRICVLKRKLKKQELTNITAMMSLKGQNQKTSVQQLGDHQYTMRDIQAIFKLIEEKSGVRIVTPQELLDWAHSNEEIANNIEKEKTVAREKLRELGAIKSQLTEQLTLLDQETGLTSAFMKRSAYEELHRKILQEKHRKQETLSRIKERRSTLASFIVSVHGLCDKLDKISLSEDWVHKLDTTLLFGNKLERKGTGQLRIQMTGNGAAGSGFTNGKSRGDITASQEGIHPHIVTSSVNITETLQAMIEKLEIILRVCNLGAEVGLLELADVNRFEEGPSLLASVRHTKPHTSASEGGSALVKATGSFGSVAGISGTGVSERQGDCEEEGGEGEGDLGGEHVLGRMRLNLLNIEEPDQTLNIRIDPRDVMEFNDGTVIENRQFLEMMRKRDGRESLAKKLATSIESARLSVSSSRVSTQGGGDDGSSTTGSSRRGGKGGDDGKNGAQGIGKVRRVARRSAALGTKKSFKLAAHLSFLKESHKEANEEFDISSMRKLIKTHSHRVTVMPNDAGPLDLNLLEETNVSGKLESFRKELRERLGK